MTVARASVILAAEAVMTGAVPVEADAACVEALDAVVRALRAGASLPDACRAACAVPVFGAGFAAAGDQLASGDSPAIVFTRLAASAPETLGLVHAGVVLEGVDASSRADALDRVVQRLRAREGDVRKVHEMKREARTSGLIVALMPVAVVLFLALASAW